MLKVKDSESSLFLNEKVINKIKAWCKANPTREWSGYLYYTAEGTLPDTMKFTGVDIYVMDVGSGTYTEYDPDSEEFLYRTENDLLNCYVAGIHSHNSMKAFHSGTDLATVEEWGSQMPHFLSLVVNNNLETDCMVSRNVSIKPHISYKTFGNKELNMVQPEESYIEGLKLKVKFQESPFDEEAKVKTAQILEEKRRKEEEKNVVYIQDKQNLQKDVNSLYTMSPVESFQYNPIEEVLPLDWEEPKVTKLSEEEVFNLTQLLVTGVIWSNIKDAKELESFIAKKMNNVLSKKFKDIDDYLEFVEFFADYIDFKISPFLDNRDALMDIASNLEDYLPNNEYIDALYNFIIEKADELLAE